MDIAGVRTQLTGLGVTLRYEDDPPNLAAQLQTERQYRASLYIQHLTTTRNFLTTTLAGPPPGGLGPDYPFVAQALAASSLLDDLAASLDEWICPAVEHAMDQAMGSGLPGAPTTYAGWFDTAVLDPNPVTYGNNVTAFFAAYPVTDHALNQITANFQSNLAAACRRIVADKAAIAALFSDRYWGLTLSALTEIKSTGSDFHKGGQQVLVLSFATRSFGGWWPLTSTLKLIYKPADVELDCLIAGESAAVNRATNNPAFMANSLVEIFNATAAANPAAGLEPLPTYRILPRNPTSPLAPPGPGAPLPIRNAYGYIEYLGYSLTGMTYGIFNYYPMGSSDYVIFESQAEAPIIEKFYHQLGQLLALAVTFSLQDLHVENVRATRYQPHLIDLEISLTSAIQDVTNTVLLTAPGPNTEGGINGDSRSNDHFVWTFNQVMVGAPPRPRYDLHRAYATKWYQNRLWALRPNKRLANVNAFWLLEGLQNGMNVLRAAQAANAFAPWFNRLANVLVRVIPVATSEWNGVRSRIYVDGVGGGALGPVLNTQLERALSNEYWNYQNALALAPPPPTPPEPDFMAFGWPQAAVDLTNFDIPVFYHRIGSTDMLDSAGAVIAVPPQITVLNQAVPPVPALSNTNVGRATYFAQPPTLNRVLNGQVVPLTGGGYAGICGQWRQQTIATLGLAAPPPNPGILIS